MKRLALVLLLVGLPLWATAPNTSNYKTQGGATWTVGGILNLAAGSHLQNAGANLTASRVLVTDSGGLPSASSVTSTTLGYLDIGSGLTALLALKAPLAAPAFTGTPTVNGGKASDVPFVRTCTLTSAAAATPVHCLVDADVGSGQKSFLTYWHAKVNGATNWATTANCFIQDTAGSPVVFVTMAVTALTGNAFVQAATSNVTLAAPFSLGTGGTTAKGLDIVCNANGTGSDLVVTMSGFMK